MSEDVIRTGRDLAYQGTVLKVYKDHMKFSNGNTEEWDFIHHDGAAAVIPVMEDGKILMVKQYRKKKWMCRLFWLENWMIRMKRGLYAQQES